METILLFLVRLKRIIPTWSRKETALLSSWKTTVDFDFFIENEEETWLVKSEL